MKYTYWRMSYTAQRILQHLHKHKAYEPETARELHACVTLRGHGMLRCGRFGFVLTALGKDAARRANDGRWNYKRPKLEPQVEPKHETV